MLSWRRDVGKVWLSLLVVWLRLVWPTASQVWSDVDNDCMWLTDYMTLQFIAIWGQLYPPPPPPPSTTQPNRSELRGAAMTTDSPLVFWLMQSEHQNKRADFTFQRRWQEPVCEQWFLSLRFKCLQHFVIRLLCTCPTRRCEELTAKPTSNSRCQAGNHLKTSRLLFRLLCSDWSVTLEHNKLQRS